MASVFSSTGGSEAGGGSAGPNENGNSVGGGLTSFNGSLSETMPTNAFSSNCRVFPLEGSTTACGNGKVEGGGPSIFAPSVGTNEQTHCQLVFEILITTFKILSL